jgi:MerR family transcriptional regulator, light-induced transcriptional regulator
MHPLYSEFISFLDRLNKEKCVQLVLSNLDEKNIDIVTLYNEILTAAQYEDLCKTGPRESCIWEEHVRTSIVRTIIECCYPYVIKERDQKYGPSSKGRAVVLCPPGELHEIGARIISDFFILCGCDALFVGANTPQEDILNALKHIKPQYIAISITNYYNLVAARSVILKIAALKGEFPFQIILGGQACRHNDGICRQMSTDMILNSFEDIQRLAEDKE